MFCQKCGTKIEDGSRFCPNCGAPLNLTAGTDPAGAPGQYPPGNAGQQPNYGAAPNAAKQKRNLVPIIAAVAVVAVVVIVVFILNRDPLVGTWQCTEYDDWILTFNKDGTFYDSDSYFLYAGQTGHWSIPTDGQLYFENFMDYEMVSYELKGKTLRIYVNGSVAPYYTFRKIK